MGEKKIPEPSPKKSKSKAKRIAKASKANSRHQPKLRRSNRQFFDKKGENSDFWNVFSKHSHHGHELVQDQIDGAIRMIYTLKEENVEDIFNVAYVRLDIHVNKLHKICGYFT